MYVYIYIYIYTYEPAGIPKSGVKRTAARYSEPINRKALME